MYSLKPKEKYAKAFGRNMRISTKDAIRICRVIRKKPLARVKRLMNDMIARKRSLGGKYYTKTVRQISDLLASCEKNALFIGLDNEKLFVHASANTGTILRRRRRKAAFGSRLKNTNVEIMLIEKGKEKKEAAKKIVEKVVKEAMPEIKKEAGKKKEAVSEKKDEKPKEKKEEKK
jgi:ribosomal protein L22